MSAMNTFARPAASYRFAAVIAALLLLSACASTSRVEVNRKAPERSYQVVNVISNPDQAGDVSAALEAALQQHGFKTRVNPAAQDSGTLTARFQDAWKRNGITFLSKLNIELLDVDSKVVLVTSNWQNTAGHQAQSVPEVVDQLVASMLTRMPVRASGAKNTQLAKAEINR
jgi:hypothetical protein